MRLLIATLLFLCSLGVSVAGAADTQLPDPIMEQRAVALGNLFRCVVCQSESINDSQADMARDLRQLVRDKIRSGSSDQQVVDYVRERYGDFILLAPPVQQNTWLLWGAPAFFLLVAATGVCVFIIRHQKEKRT